MCVSERSTNHVNGWISGHSMIQCARTAHLETIHIGFPAEFYTLMHISSNTLTFQTFVLQQPSRNVLQCCVSVSRPMIDQRIPSWHQVHGRRDGSRMHSHSFSNLINNTYCSFTVSVHVHARSMILAHVHSHVHTKS